MTARPTPPAQIGILRRVSRIDMAGHSTQSAHPANSEVGQTFMRLQRSARAPVPSGSGAKGIVRSHDMLYTLSRDILYTSALARGAQKCPGWRGKRWTFVSSG